LFSGCAEERTHKYTKHINTHYKNILQPSTCCAHSLSEQTGNISYRFFYFYKNSWLSLFDIFMGSYSIGEAINLLMQKSGWKPKVNELRLRQEWEAIAGKTISKYTRNLYLSGTTLTIYTDVAPLKQELLLGKEQLAARINEYFEERVVEDIVIK
jgi:hypothetical protein